MNIGQHEAYMLRWIAGYTDVMPRLTAREIATAIQNLRDDGYLDRNDYPTGIALDWLEYDRSL